MSVNDPTTYTAPQECLARLTRPTHAHSWSREIYYRAHYWINAYPFLYMPIVRYRHRFLTDRVVTPETDLVIEAFGRSGTTFANVAFLSVQARRVRTVHHTHAAAQVITAVRMKIPTLVIVRQPESVALSHMVRHRVSARPALEAWIRFHQRLARYAKGIAFCSFDELTHNFTPVIERLNQRFGTCFDVWQHTQENEAEIFAHIKTRNRGRFSENAAVERDRAFALPTPEREALKEELRSQLLAHALAPLRDRADHLYQSLIV